MGDAGSGALVLLLLELQRLGGEWSNNINPIIDQTKEKFTSLAETIRNNIVGTLRGAFEGLFSDILSGARSFGDALISFFQSVVNSIIAIVARMASISIINLLFGLKIPLFAKGGIIQGGLAPAFAGMQSGGIVHRPTMAMVGEGGQSEAVIPLPDNRHVPVKMIGQGGSKGRELMIHFIVSNVWGDPSSVKTSPDEIRAVVVNDVTQRGPIMKAIRMVIP